MRAMTSTEHSLITPQMIEELSPSLLKFALRKVARREDAEDLVQETWISALRTATTFEGRSSLRAWMIGIMRRRIADHYRRDRPAALFEEEEFASNVRSPAEHHDWEETTQSALAAFDKLTTLERSALTLCDLEDMDRDEAADQLRVKRGHLRVILFRARGKLEHSLRSQGLSLCA
jgi:RNA polymerase sigma-70 factor (ECF subfamily)